MLLTKRLNNHSETIQMYVIREDTEDADEQFAKYFVDGEIKQVEQKSLSDL